MAPIQPLTYLDCNVGRFVGVGECVFAHCYGADQQPYCILGKGRPTCRLENFSMQMGHASPLACCAPHDSFRVSNRGSRLSKLTPASSPLNESGIRGLQPRKFPESVHRKTPVLDICKPRRVSATSTLTVHSPNEDNGVRVIADCNHIQRNVNARIWDSTHPVYFLAITSFAVFPAVR
jgi:hypothetical protein